MLARMRAAIGLDQVHDLLGDRAQGGDTGGLLQVQDRPDMERADRGMGVPGRVGAVAGENLGQARRVVGQMRQRHRAVLDERHRLGIAGHRHRDVEPGRAHLPDPGLARRLRHVEHGSAVAEVAQQLVQPGEPRLLRRKVVARELDQQQRVGRAAHERLDQRPIGGDPPAQLDDLAIDQLDRARPQGGDRLGRGHGVVEAPELADAQEAVARQGLQLELEALEQSERALGADQERGQVRLRPQQPVQIVAADPALQLRETLLDGAALAFGQGEEALAERG